jgi:hypothetical protein
MKTLVAFRIERMLLLVSLCLAVLFAVLWARSFGTSAEPARSPSVQAVEPVEQPGSLASLPRSSSLQANASAPIQAAALVQDATQHPSRFVRHEDRFAHDARGGAWVNTARESLLDAAAEPALTAFGVPNSFNADCSSRMCRIAMDFESRTAADDWAEFLPLGMGKEFAAVDTLRTETPDGRHVLLVYGARIGHAALITAQ